MNKAPLTSIDLESWGEEETTVQRRIQESLVELMGRLVDRLCQRVWRRTRSGCSHFSRRYRGDLSESGAVSLSAEE